MPRRGATSAPRASRHCSPKRIRCVAASTSTRAADTIYAIASYEGYELLVNERGWTADEYERWLADTLCDLVLEPTAH